MLWLWSSLPMASQNKTMHTCTPAHTHGVTIWSTASHAAFSLTVTLQSLALGYSHPLSFAIDLLLVAAIFINSFAKQHVSSALVNLLGLFSNLFVREASDTIWHCFVVLHPLVWIPIRSSDQGVRLCSHCCRSFVSNSDNNVKGMPHCSKKMNKYRYI